MLSGVHTDAITVSYADGLVLETRADVDGGYGVVLDPSRKVFNVEAAAQTVARAGPGPRSRR